MNDIALNTDAFAMDDAALGKAGAVAFLEVFFYYACDVFRLEGVQIENVGDGENYNLTQWQISRHDWIGRCAVPLAH